MELNGTMSLLVKYFGSRDSFFHKPNKSGKEEEWARCTIRRWV